MVLNKICDLNENKKPLEMINLPDPVPGKKEILVKVSACGVCHTELKVKGCKSLTVTWRHSGANQVADLHQNR